MSQQIFFVDSSVAGSDELKSALELSVGEGSKVFVLENNSDAFKQMDAALASLSEPASAVHVYAHGAAGSVTLGGRNVDQAVLDESAAILDKIGGYLTEDADILLYSCNTAQGSSGQRFIERLAALTRADVAGSTDVTGESGNWVLEYATGPVETAPRKPDGFTGNLDGHVMDANAPGWGNIFGTDRNDVLRGFVSDDRFYGRGGADTMVGGEGNDVYIVSGTDTKNTLVLEEQNGGTDTVFSQVEDFDLSAGDNTTSVESVTATGTTSEVEYIVLQAQDSMDAQNATGNNAAQTIVGNALSNNLTGKGGNDYLDGGDGDDFLDGGSGVKSPQELRYGETFKDYNTNDMDTLVGGRGNDSYIVRNEGDVVVEKANEGTDNVFSFSDYRLSDNVENLTLLDGASAEGATQARIGEGNALGNVLRGNSAANALYGYEGNDTLYGSRAGEAGDSLMGGAGNDVYRLYSAADSVYDSSGVDTAYWGGTDVGFTLGAGVEHLSLFGEASVAAGNGLNNSIEGNVALANTLSGGAGNDSLVGGMRGDSLDGGAGNDVMTGGAGDDLYVIDSAGDRAIEKVGEGLDSIRSNGISIDLGKANYANVEHVKNTGGRVTLTGTVRPKETLVAGSNGDVLDGKGGGDSLLGGAGDDRISFYAGDVAEGGGGADTLLVQAGVDLVTTQNAKGFTVIDLAKVKTPTPTSVDMTGASYGVSISGNAAANNLVGGSKDDRILAGGGRDTINAGAGDDFVELTASSAGYGALDGGAGNDTLSFGSAADNISLNAGGFVQTIGKTRVTVAATDLEAYDGGAGNDTIDASAISGGVVLLGGVGNDRLIGGNGDDTLVADGGSDTISTGVGSDMVCMTRGAVGATVTVTDFNVNRDIVDDRDFQGWSRTFSETFNKQTGAYTTSIVWTNPANSRQKATLVIQNARKKDVENHVGALTAYLETGDQFNAAEVNPNMPWLITAQGNSISATGSNNDDTVRVVGEIGSTDWTLNGGGGNDLLSLGTQGGHGLKLTLDQFGDVDSLAYDNGASVSPSITGFEGYACDGGGTNTFDARAYAMGEDKSLVLEGGAGHDMFYLGDLSQGGSVTMRGNGGRDSFHLSSVGGNAHVVIDGGDGDDTLTFDNLSAVTLSANGVVKTQNGDVTMNSVEAVRVADNGNVKLGANSLKTTLIFGSGNDTLVIGDNAGGSSVTVKGFDMATDSIDFATNGWEMSKKYPNVSNSGASSTQYTYTKGNKTVTVFLDGVGDFSETNAKNASTGAGQTHTLSTAAWYKGSLYGDTITVNLSGEQAFYVDANGAKHHNANGGKMNRDYVSLTATGDTHAEHVISNHITDAPDENHISSHSRLYVTGGGNASMKFSEFELSSSEASLVEDTAGNKVVALTAFTTRTGSADNLKAYGFGKYFGTTGADSVDASGIQNAALSLEYETNGGADTFRGGAEKDIVHVDSLGAVSGRVFMDAGDGTVDTPTNAYSRTVQYDREVTGYLVNDPDGEYYQWWDGMGYEQRDFVSNPTYGWHQETRYNCSWLDDSNTWQCLNNAKKVTGSTGDYYVGVDSTGIERQVSGLESNFTVSEDSVYCSTVKDEMTLHGYMRMQSDGNSFFEWWDENNMYHQVVADGDAALPDDNPQWIRETSKEYVQDSLLLEHLGGDANISFDKDGDASVTVGNNGKTHTFKNFECVHAIADEGQTVTFHAGGFLASTVGYDQEAPWKHLSVGANEHDDPGTYVFDLGWNADPLSAAGNVSFYAGGGASGDIFMVGSTENDFGNIQLSGGQGNDTYKLRAEGHAVTILDNAFGNKQGQVPSGEDTVQFFGVDSNFEVNSLRFFWSGDKTGGGTLIIANVDGKWGALGPNPWPNNTLTICYSNLLDKNTVTYGNLQGDHMQFFGNSETNLLADVDLNSVVTAMTGKDRSWDDNCQRYSTGWVQLSFTDGKVS